MIRPAGTIETGLARATGTIRAREDAVLSAKATGQIRRVRVQVGDRVKTGAVLADMDSTNAQIGLQNARAMERLAVARLAEAEREVTRGKMLFEGQGMPQSAWDQVQTGREIAAAQLDQARAAVRQAEQAVQDASITAPFGGIVTAKFRNAGDTVTLMPVSPIVALTDVEHLEIRLTATDFGHFGDGGGVFLPATAVRTDGKASWVFVVTNGKAERRDVVVQAVHPGTVVVKQGLAPDADVVVDPGALAAGDAIVALAN